MKKKEKISHTSTETKYVSSQSYFKKDFIMQPVIEYIEFFNFEIFILRCTCAVKSFRILGVRLVVFLAANELDHGTDVLKTEKSNIKSCYSVENMGKNIKFIDILDKFHYKFYRWAKIGSVGMWCDVGDL